MARTDSVLGPRHIGDLAVRALREEAELTPKPGLVDRRSGGAHHDMDLDLLLTSADSLREAFTGCARLSAALPLGSRLRARVGEAGREGERRMLEATGGVNTHRGALWALGLLAAGASRAAEPHDALGFAARLARIPDRHVAVRRPAAESHGARAHRLFGAGGAAAEARAGFPHIAHVALPALRAARRGGADEQSARLTALLSLMATLEDTCLLHRGGQEGLRTVRRAATDALAAGGSETPAGRRRLRDMDARMRARRLSPGGSADLLAATVFVDLLYPHPPVSERSSAACRP